MPRTYGLLAEFDKPMELVAAARATYDAGFRKIDAYTPYPLEEAAEVIGFHKNNVALITLIGGICGFLAGYMLEYWVSTTAYPLNIGGRPYHSAPQFIPVAFETTVLGAALSAVFGMLGMNGLPQPYHPVFNVPSFAMSASKDKFFLLIESTDPKFDENETRNFLQQFNPVAVSEVEP
jgi:hypothetical protein